MVWAKKSDQNDADLCANPVVYSADRLNSKTVRLFRGDKAWDLTGFPDHKSRPVETTKLAKNTFKHLLPVTERQRVVTVSEGSPSVVNLTVKFGDKRWWGWAKDSETGDVTQLGTSVGYFWDQIPRDNGFAAVFHNADKEDPMLIGLEANAKHSNKHMKIHYFSTKEGKGFLIPKKSHYFDEKDFPIDMTDAFSWPSKASKYTIYIIRKDKYCRLTDAHKACCTKWESNEQLFGCSYSKTRNFSPPEEVKNENSSPNAQEANPNDGKPAPVGESVSGAVSTAPGGQPPTDSASNPADSVTKPTNKTDDKPKKSGAAHNHRITTDIIV
ncbi:unnamed protein product [Medioppia subpectinata]|uniref:Uncharacterized protein n=1 Tax=Medioppia subpectinata TaxID=1979941 RepID=A0A7R9Q369_9ACAR|nr:unnamed protein product [Medioppia subpectinata]CAG2110211.1 unnamed protein product [Medioppia subpectinata]